VAEEAITRQWGSGALSDIVEEMLVAAGASRTLTELLKGQQQVRQDERDGRYEPSLLPVQDLRRAVLGSVVNLLARALPADEERLAGLLMEGHDQLARRLISDGVGAAEKVIGDYLQRALKHSSAVAKAVQAGK
jgi:hypothetical protein